MRIISGNSFLYCLMQFINFFVFLSGFTLLTSIVILYTQVNSSNSFISSSVLISIMIIFTSSFGFFCTKNSPFGILFYQILLFSLSILTFTLAFFLIFDQSRIINLLINHIPLDELSDKIKSNIHKHISILTKGVFFYSSLIVFILCKF
jgi:hypothetical protein